MRKNNICKRLSRSLEMLCFVLLIIGFFSMFWFYVTSFQPSGFSITTSTVLSILIVFLVGCSVHFNGSTYEPRIKELSTPSKAYIFLLCAFGCFFAFLFTVSYALHVVFSKQEERAVYIVPLGETGRRLSHCGSTVRITAVKDFLTDSYGAEMRDICFDQDAYHKIHKVYSANPGEKAKVFLIDYTVSMFGEEYFEGTTRYIDRE